MQKLHLVGFTTDHKSLILSARRGARSGGFVLAIDDAVAAAVQEAIDAAEAGGGGEEVEDAVPAAPPRPQSTLSVKELQARLRSGRTIESVAAEAGVDAEWVTRFAMPVLAEQARVIDATKNATFSRARLGPSAQPLGASVYRNLVAKGIRNPVDELDQGWSTRQGADGRWLVTFVYTSRGKRHRAVWELDLRSKEVKAVDRQASALAFVPGAAPTMSVPAPSKPAKRADQPSDIDRANARRVAEARKQATAQLTEAARQGSKRSVEAARRAGAAKPKKKRTTPTSSASSASGAAADPVAAVRQAADALLTDDVSVLTEGLRAPSPLPRVPDRGAAAVVAVEDEADEADEAYDDAYDDAEGYDVDAVDEGYDVDAVDDGDQDAAGDEAVDDADVADGDDGWEGADDDADEPARPVRARPVEARRRPPSPASSPAGAGQDRPVRAASTARPARPGQAGASERPGGRQLPRPGSAPASASDRGERARPARPAAAASTDRPGLRPGERPRPARPADAGGAERGRPVRPDDAGGPERGRPARVVAADDGGDRTAQLPRIRADRGAPAASTAPAVPRPSRALTRAIGSDDDLRASEGRTEEPRRSQLRFRGDLAAPAAPAGRNGDGPGRRGTAGAAGTGRAASGDGQQASAEASPPRRRREPLRAR